MLVEITPEQCREMTELLLDFGERHDLTMAETYFAVVAAIAQSGYILKETQCQ